MEDFGKPERITQNRVVKLLREKLNYGYLGWLDDVALDNRCIDVVALTKWLTDTKRYSEDVVKQAVQKLYDAAYKWEDKLYEQNKLIYQMLKYGIQVKNPDTGLFDTVKVIDWDDIGNNRFEVAEEVTVKEHSNNRPDVVVYVNGIALAVIEFKKSTISVANGIRQNLINQGNGFIPHFFSTVQFVMAANDSEGLRYGAIETQQRYYMQWKDDGFKEHDEDRFDYDVRIDAMAETFGNGLDKAVYQMFSQARFLRLIQCYVMFDRGAKKLARYSQYYGCQRTINRLAQGKGGIFWHTQGSGKSMSMMWLAEILLETYADGRVLIVTDREELDEQMEKNYARATIPIYRTKSGGDLLKCLDKVEKRRICSLVHKFGRHVGNVNDKDWEHFVEEINASLPENFAPKGRIFVFVDECHRTQSGVLNRAMKAIIPNGVFVGFTGTPLLKSEKKKLTSMENFGPFIHTYRYNEGVADGVILDLQYESRDSELRITNQAAIDAWFDAQTQGLTDKAKAVLKREWAKMQKLYSSSDRLQKIACDIYKDFKMIPRLMNGGNAILVAESIYAACRFYEIFNQWPDFKGKFAIISSYVPDPHAYKQDFIGSRDDREAQAKYQIYLDMLGLNEQGADEIEGLEKKVSEFEEEIKRKFIEEPYKMKLLIVVDKLLTGFDAPHCTYLYVDKNMRDQGLFQAVCRVNRLDGNEKEFGYIVDYKNLFGNLSDAMHAFTTGAFDAFDEEDIDGLLKNHTEQSKRDFLGILEILDGMCKGLPNPATEDEVRRYFCGRGDENEEEKFGLSRMRSKLYFLVRKLTVAFADFKLCYYKMDYSDEDKASFEKKVTSYVNMSLDIGLASGDSIDISLYSGEMRDLIDMYVSADSAKKIADLSDFTLMEYINANKEELEKGKKKDKEMNGAAEVIENNMRREISERIVLNPKYFAKMSELLQELIEERQREVADYKVMLEKYQELVKKVMNPENSGHYPDRIKNSPTLRAWYDYTEGNEELSLAIDNAINNNISDDFQQNLQKMRKLKKAIYAVVSEENKVDEIYEILCANQGRQ